MIVLEDKVSQSEDSLSVSRSLYLQEALSVDLDVGVAFLKKGVDASCHFGPIFAVSVNIEGRIFSKLSGSGKTNAKHILLLAGNGEIVLMIVVID